MPPRKRSSKKRAKKSSKTNNETESPEDERVASKGPQSSVSNFRPADSSSTVVPSSLHPSSTLTPPHPHPSTSGTAHTLTAPPVTTPVQPSHLPSPTFTPVSQLDLTVTYDYGGGFPGSGIAVSPRKSIEEISNLFNFKDSNPRVSHHVNLWRDLSPSSHTPPPPKRHKPHHPHTLTTHAVKDYQTITLLASQLQDRLAKHSRDKSQFPGCKTKLCLDEEDLEEDKVKCEGTANLEGDSEEPTHQKTTDSSLPSFGCEEEDEGFWATAAVGIDSPSNMPMAGSTPCHAHQPPLTRTKLFHTSEVGTLKAVNNCHQPKQRSGAVVADYQSQPSSHSPKALDFDQAFENESDEFLDDQLLLDGFDSAALQEGNECSLQRKPITWSKDGPKEQRVTVEHDNKHQNLQGQSIAPPIHQSKANISNQTCYRIDPKTRPKLCGSELPNAVSASSRPVLHHSSSTQRVMCSQTEIELKREQARSKLLARKNLLLSQQ